jgi:hypothetical protein
VEASGTSLDGEPVTEKWKWTAKEKDEEEGVRRRKGNVAAGFIYIWLRWGRGSAGLPAVAGTGCGGKEVYNLAGVFNLFLFLIIHVFIYLFFCVNLG